MFQKVVTGILVPGFLIFLSLFVSDVSAAKSPVIAIIIDDLGTNWLQAKRVLKLPPKIATSILPFTPHSLRIAGEALLQNRPILLHAPMEANEGNHLLGAGALSSTMNCWDLLKQLRQDIVSIPGVEGVNNHMGSLMTQDKMSMRWVMGMLWWQGLYFVDSRTSAESVAEDVARSMGVSSTRRDVFLDNLVSEDAINEQFDRLIALARKNGKAVAIGHPHPETLQVLENRLPELEQQGVELFSISELVHR